MSRCELVLDRISNDDLNELASLFRTLARYFGRRRPSVAQLYVELRDFIDGEIGFRSMFGVSSAGAQRVDLDAIELISDAELIAFTEGMLSWGERWHFINPAVVDLCGVIVSCANAELTERGIDVVT